MALSVLDVNTGAFVKLSTTDPDGEGEVKLNIGGITISGGLTVDNVTVTNFPDVQDIQGNVIVSGTVATTLTGNPTVTITNLPSISGTVDAGTIQWSDTKFSSGLTSFRGNPSDGDFAPANKVGLDYDEAWFNTEYEQ